MKLQYTKLPLQMRTYEQTCDIARKELDRKETYNRLIAIPLCMGEVVWDMVDSVKDMLAFMRVHELKLLCRTLAQFRKEYAWHFEDSGIKRNKVETLRVWMENYLEYSNGANSEYKELEKAVREVAPDLSDNWISLITSAYLAWAYAKALIEYTDDREAEFAKKINLPNHGHLLPKQMRNLPILLSQVWSDIEIDSKVLNRIKNGIKDEMIYLGYNATEPEARTKYRESCVAFRLYGGCKAQAKYGVHGCYPSSNCKRMLQYDTKHKHKTEILPCGE